MCSSPTTGYDVLMVLIFIVPFVGFYVVSTLHINGYFSPERCKERRLRNTFQGLDEKFAERRRQIQR